MNDAKSTKWRIRILNGPLRGVTHTVRKRVSIGRASSSDIQLVHDGISRQHAQIIVDEHGRHVLQDLDSSNGTFVERERIRRHSLTPGTVFKIMKVRLVYEPSTDESVDCEESGVFAVRKIDRTTLRGTIDYGELDLPQPAAPRASDDAVETVDEPDAPRPRNRGDSSSAPAVQARAEERHRVIARYPDGSLYEGSLIDDVVEYREIRTRQRRGDELLTAELEQYERLDERLRIPEDDDPARRVFCRFESNFPVKLRFSDGTEISAAVLNMGVDGAKLRAYDHQIEHDAIVWLAIHLVSRGRALTVAFTSRVVWTCRDHIGLGFAGAPGWEQRGGHRKVVIRTHMDLRDQVRAARSTLARLKLRTQRRTTDEL